MTYFDNKILMENILWENFISFDPDQSLIEVRIWIRNRFFGPGFFLWLGFGSARLATGDVSHERRTAQELRYKLHGL